jgi:hypothetical protein
MPMGNLHCIMLLYHGFALSGKDFGIISVLMVKVLPELLFSLLL